MIDFNFSPMEEDIGIFGKKGTGKTTRAKMILDLIPNIARIIWSPQKALENFGGYGEPVDKIEDLHHGAFIWTGIYNKATFLNFCNKVMEFKNLVLVVDDCHEYVSKQFMPPEFETLVMSGRNRGISGIYLSPFPAQVPNQILGNCTHIFNYQMNLISQIEWVRDNFFGDSAWLLLPKNLRNKMYISNNDIDILPQYAFLYRKDSDMRTQFSWGGQSDEIKASDEIKEDSEPNANTETSDSSVSGESLSQEIQQREKSEHTPENSP